MLAVSLYTIHNKKVVSYFEVHISEEFYNILVNSEFYNIGGIPHEKIIDFESQRIRVSVITLTKSQKKDFIWILNKILVDYLKQNYLKDIAGFKENIIKKYFLMNELIQLIEQLENEEYNYMERR